MPWTIERLRLAIVALAAVLLLAILGSFFYGRWRLRHIAQDLPARLGIQIQQTTQGFVFSKTEQGRPVFTLRAARAVAFKTGGRVLLHDVEIDMYNRQDGSTDIIAGKDFEYDRDRQIVVAQGEAHIVLRIPASHAATARADKNASQPIRVTTHGLVFNQKTGVATCSGEVDFQVADASGQAVGAEYDSRQGHLLLQSQVALTTEMQNRPAVIHAAQATYDRAQGEVHLRQPRYSSKMKQGSERGTAGTATVYLRPDGSAERLDAQNGVELASSDGTTVHAASMNALLNASSQPQHVHFAGNVKFAQNQPQQQTLGSAQDAAIDFDAHGRAHRAVLDREVELHQRMDAGNSRAQRTLTANRLVLFLLSAKTGQAQLRTADATGNAVFTSRTTVPGRPAQQTVAAAQVLKANFLPGNLIQHIDGAGQTRLETIAANGNLDTSTGDTLSIDFAADQSAMPHRQTSRIQTSVLGANSRLPTQSIRSAVQTGHVVLQQAVSANQASSSKGSESAPQISTANAERAEYEASADTLVLTGKPRFRDAQLEMSADRMEARRASDTMVAIGDVQATLRSSKTAEEVQGGGMLAGNLPVHIVAARATLSHSAQRAEFAGHARLWQEEDMIEAPVIELSRKTQRLLAYSDVPCLQCVHSTFLEQANSGQASQDRAGVPMHRGPFASRKNSEPSAFRVLSGRMLYAGAERKASFQDRVELIGQSGQISAERAEIFLTSAVPGHPGKEGSLSSGRNNPSQPSIERIVALGDVRLIQPGRLGTGAKLIYTASNGQFVLTGDGKSLPEIVDADRGTVKGKILTFRSQEQEILVNGTLAQPTTTVTRVRRK